METDELRERDKHRNVEHTEGFGGINVQHGDGNGANRNMAAAIERSAAIIGTQTANVIERSAVVIERTANNKTYTQTDSMNGIGTDRDGLKTDVDGFTKVHKASKYSIMVVENPVEAQLHNRYDVLGRT